MHVPTALLGLLLLADSPGMSAEVPQNQATRRQLSAAATIDGVACAATGRFYAEFHASGRLEWCPLAHDTTIAGQSLPAATWIQLTDAGVLFGGWLSRDAALSGHRCRGEGYKKWSVRFHANGALASCYLPTVAVIEGIPCQRGTFLNEVRGGGKSAVHFRPDGRLAQCMASKDFVRNGVKIRKWTVVKP